MLFNSYYFILYFLPVVLLCYYGAFKIGKPKMALIVISLASFVFYAYDNLYYLALLGGSILVNWIVAYCINHYAHKKVLFVIGIIFDITLIFIFKYYDFFVGNINFLFGIDLKLTHFLLPMGISFFTFQQISFLVDTYKGETKNYSFVEYVAFVSFFAQLVAGPIVLHNELITQYRDKNRWKVDSDRFAHGVYAFSIGLSKKVLLADVFGKAVSWAWRDLGARTSAEMALSMICYTFQIYFDFSGYCDMAIGIGKLFNIDLPVNFNSPYKAVSINDFWKRWHMTLTRFLTKYIYIPIGGNRKGRIRTFLNIIIVFFISGLWHGANWTFVLWGFLHGMLQIINRLVAAKWKRVPKLISWAMTFLIVNFLWVMFYAPSVEDCIYVWRKILTFDGFHISPEMLGTFVNDDINTILTFVKPISEVLARFPYCYMLVYLIIAFVASVCCKNIHEEIFSPTKIKAIMSAIMMIWAILSLSGVSTFLYSNF